MILFLLLACTTEKSIEIHFLPMWKEQHFSCTKGPVTDLRFYISELYSWTEEGDIRNLNFVPGPLQTDKIAFLDFEDGSGVCKGGSDFTKTSVQIKVPTESLSGLGFQISVPFSNNHQDPTKARGPLSLSSMHWNWKGGYKFLRMSVREKGQTPYKIHIGSTGCTGTMGNISSCKRSNRIAVEIRGYRFSDATIPIHLDKWVGDINFSSSGGCMSNPDDEGCRSVFPRLGLDIETGEQNGFAVGF